MAKSKSWRDEPPFTCDQVPWRPLAPTETIIKLENAVRAARTLERTVQLLYPVTDAITGDNSNLRAAWTLRTALERELKDAEMINSADEHCDVCDKLKPVKGMCKHSSFFIKVRRSKLNPSGLKKLSNVTACGDCQSESYKI